MDGSSVKDWILPGITIVLFLGAAAIYLRGAISAGTIKALQDNNSALSDRVKVLEDESASQKVKIAEQGATIQSQQAEISALIAQRPSADIIAGIDRKLDEYVFKIRKVERS